MNTAVHSEKVLEAKRVHFVGIGGIGMSALARFYLQAGAEVTGYDRTETDLTKALVGEGASIHYTDDASLIPTGTELAVYTPAIPKDSVQLAAIRDRNIPLLKRSDVLQAISQNRFAICVGGTHGKSTITCMIAHILRHTGHGCTAFLGAISTNWGTNFWSHSNNVVVIEADEYDRSFLKLSPDVAVISAMDPDHLDIYGTPEAVVEAFVAFGERVKPGGTLWHKHGLKGLNNISVVRYRYSHSNDASDAYASDVKTITGGYNFDLHAPRGSVSGAMLRLGGRHNVENMVVAMAIALQLGIDSEAIREAVAAFSGVKRRFEYLIPPQEAALPQGIQPVLIDDYAHHPAELAALLQGVRSLFPHRKITLIFQPHLYSRTRDFREGFAQSLSAADAVILLPIYAAREKPIDGVDAAMLLAGMAIEDKKVLSKEALLDWANGYAQTLDKEFGEVIVTAGAGDIDTLVQPLKNIFDKA